jgi:hypothetical protein
MLVDFCAIHDRRVDGLAGIIQHDDTTALAAHILNGLMQHTLKHRPQVQRGRDFAADMKEKLE